MYKQNRSQQKLLTEINIILIIEMSLFKNYFTKLSQKADSFHVEFIMNI